MKYLLIIPLTLLLVGCCGENYVKEMKILSTNTSQQIFEFNKENKRHPTIKERNKIFDKAGCKIKSQNVCSLNGRDITIKSEEHLSAYNVSLYYGKNKCFYELLRDGSLDSISCRKDSCDFLQIKQ